LSAAMNQDISAKERLVIRGDRCVKSDAVEI
jgi:hypothetical protein